MNKTRSLVVTRSNDIPGNWCYDHKWYANGCYHKVDKQKNFRSTRSLRADLEYLFISGFNSDGLKRGKNKFNPKQALAFLKNLKIGNGRRKYSNVEGNIHGQLPTKAYIWSWFSIQKNKLAKQEIKRLHEKYEHGMRKAEERRIAEGEYLNWKWSNER